jgi:hypothetical protein
VEHEEQAERMEREVERMEHESERVGDHIDETRTEWEAKEEDASVPGARPDRDVEEEDAEDAPGEEKRAVTATPREESDQLPEEGPAGQVPDDDGGAVRDEARDSPGVQGEEETGTGSPAAAGADEPDSGEDE